jgi:hypothetical protein
MIGDGPLVVFLRTSADRCAGFSSVAVLTASGGYPPIQVMY